MKYLVALFTLCFFTLQTFAQQEYFVYLQTDNNQPFYLRINNTVYSSTSSGYLILSKIPDATASITIGFPKNVFPEQLFSVPVNHKDGGYLVKNFGDKGWGLFNLQSLVVIMNSNPPEEKKNLEITGIKKTDDFSLLLANAVNDTAVLYTVNKAKPLEPPVIAATEEKKADTALMIKNASSKNDTAALVKNTTEKKDSALVVKNTVKTTKDSLSSAKPHAPVVKEMAVLEKDKKVTGDTVSAAKNTIATTNPATEKHISRTGKDTIIMMTGGATDSNKSVAKNTTKKKTGEKTITPPVISLPGATKTIPAKKDTVAAIVKNDAPVFSEEKKDSSFNEPVKRKRPTVTKAVELLTDTSYVAIYMDESNDNADTIRISIPFDNTIAYVKKDKPVATRDDYKVVAEEQHSSVTKKDSSVPDKIVKDTPQTIAQQPTTNPVKKDTPAITKSSKDTAPVITTAQTTVPAKKDTTAANNLPKDTAPVIAKQTTTPAKKDSFFISAVPDSGKPAKAQPLLLNSDCKEIAWDVDIDKLRIKMLLVSSDEERIALAKKVYRQKCFSVKQVKALSELFKTDEGKYKWFDAVYPFVSDSGNFYMLSELLKNDYYLNRFKAMLRK